MPRFRFDDPWRVLWRILTSDTILAAVLLALALALFLAAWLPQTTQADANLDVAWQAEVQRRFGGIAWFETLRPMLQAGGVFNITDAPGFRILLAILALALLARLMDSVEALWHAWRRPSPSKKAAGNGAPATLGHSKRLPWRALGLAGVYLGGLVVLLGAAITSQSGWQMGPLPLTPGESLPLAHDTDLAVRLEALAPDGRRGAGEIWRGGDTLVAAGELAVGQPLQGAGVGVYLVGSGEGVRIEATAGDGQPLDLAVGPGSVARQNAVVTFSADEPRYLVGVPQADLVLLLKVPGEEGTDSQVQVYRSGTGQFLLEQAWRDATIVTLGDVSFSLTPTLYARIRVVRDGGAFWSQLGIAGLLAGAIVLGVAARRPGALESTPGDAERVRAALTESVAPEARPAGNGEV